MLVGVEYYIQMQMRAEGRRRRNRIHVGCCKEFSWMLALISETLEVTVGGDRTLLMSAVPRIGLC